MGKRSFSIQYKLEVADFAIKNSINSASKTYGVDRKVIRRWKETKDKLELEIGAGNKKKKKLSGTGKKIISFDMEQDLVSWIETNNKQDLHVSRSSIMKRARAKFNSYDDTDGKNFKGTEGWLQGFMVRNDLSLRRRTTLAQKDPDDLIPKIVSYVMFVSRMRQKYSIGPENLIAMDETPVFFDMPATTTVTKKGTKSVGIKTTGHEKSRVTVCLAACGDGRKLKPFIVFRDGIREVTKMRKEQEFDGVEIRVQKSSWMDAPLTIDWLDTVLKKSASPETRLLAWDSFKCHFSPETINHLSGFNTKMALIPGGLTKYIQAPDVSWNKPFKADVKSCYDDWMSNEDNMSLTDGGNLRAPPRREIVNWVMKAWEKLSPEIIIKSFKSCALSIDPAGSEDHLIHCLKFGERCREAWDLLQKYRDGDENVIQEVDGGSRNSNQVTKATTQIEQNYNENTNGLDLQESNQTHNFEVSNSIVQMNICQNDDLAFSDPPTETSSSQLQNLENLSFEISQVTSDTSSNFSLDEHEENEAEYYENLYLYDPSDAEDT